MRHRSMIIALVAVSLLVLPTPWRRGTAEEAETGNTKGPASRTRLQTGAWGAEELGLQCRVRAPAEIEQGMPLQVQIELRSHLRKLQPGVKNLNGFLPGLFLRLSLSNLQTGKVFTVQPWDPTRGMPVFDRGKDAVPLKATGLKPWQTSFPLVRSGDSLQPGLYDCQVSYSFPKKRTRWWSGSDTQWQDGGFWNGTVVSGRFRLKVLEATPKTETFLLPKRLRMEKGMIRFHKEDAEEVKLPVRNGFLVGTRFYRGKKEYMLQSGAPKPDDVNCIDRWHGYEGGNKNVSYTIEVFETADPPCHMWSPGEVSGVYRVLWKKTLPVSVVKEEIRLEGHVTLDGLPLKKGHITFRPLPGTPGPAVGGAVADGRFSISPESKTFAGNYRVEITAKRLSGKKTFDEKTGRHVDTYEQFLPAKYNTKSKIKVKVNPDTTNPFGFSLSSE